MAVPRKKKQTRWGFRRILWVRVLPEKYSQFLEGTPCDNMWISGDGRQIIAQRSATRYRCELYIKKDGILGRIAYILSGVFTEKEMQAAMDFRLKRWEGFTVDPDPFVIETDFQECRWSETKRKILLPFEDKI